MPMYEPENCRDESLQEIVFELDKIADVLEEILRVLVLWKGEENART